MISKPAHPGEWNSVGWANFAEDDNCNGRESTGDTSKRYSDRLLRLQRIMCALSDELETFSAHETTSTRLAILATKLRNCHSASDDGQLKGRLMVLARLTLDWCSTLEEKQ